MWPPVNNGFSVFGHFFVEHFYRTVKIRNDCIKWADPDATPATCTLVFVDSHFPVCIFSRCSMGTNTGAAATAHAGFLPDMWFPVAVLVFFSSPGATAHADIFDRPAKSC